MAFWDDMGAIAGNLAKAARNATEEAAKGPPVKTDDKPAVEAPKDGPDSLLWDPFAIVEQLGFKDRPSAITYGTLNSMVARVPLVQAIIVTRLNQLSRFCKPRSDMFVPGFHVVPVDPDAEMSPADRKFARKLESMMMTTGVTKNPNGRDDLETFCRKIGRDSLTYDQYCVELVMNNAGQPAQFYAVDAATIRLADTVNITYTEDPDLIVTVQVYDNMVINEWRRNEMAFCVRNPQTNIRSYGYGYSELEMLITAVTSWLWGYDYNSRFFNQGTVAKGILNIQGTMNQTQLKAFRRQWYQQVSGVENAWRSPVLNADGKVEWVNMSQTNRDMEFSDWMDFLIKLICGVFQIDSMELGFKYGNTGQDKAMFESGTEAKLTASKDRGLSPFLEHIAKNLSAYIIHPIDKDWKFEFVGLETHSKDDLAKLNEQRVKVTHTVNELRKEQGMTALEGEEYDTVLNPVVAQLKSAAQQAEMQMQQAAEQGEDGEGPEDFNESDFAAFEGDDEDDQDDGDSVEKSMRVLVTI